jgi:hypothetical protein
MRTETSEKTPPAADPLYEIVGAAVLLRLSLDAAPVGYAIGVGIKILKKWCSVITFRRSVIVSEMVVHVLGV